MFIIIVLLMAKVSFADTKESLSLLPLTMNIDMEPGCACSVMDSKEQTFVNSGINTSDPATIKINGDRIKLNPVNPPKLNTKPKIGDKITEVYSNKDYKLILDKEISFLCSPTDEGCEVTRYKVNLELKKGKKSIKMPNLKGDCGC
jgi:hypothetical protein